MEYRVQTYIGAVQLLAVIAGSLILRMSVKGMEDLLNPDYYPDPLKYLRPLSQYGWTLILIPIAWVVLTIRGERSDLWWATRSFTIGSGIVIILGLLVLFGWAGFAVSSIAFGGA